MQFKPPAKDLFKLLLVVIFLMLVIVIATFNSNWFYDYKLPKFNFKEGKLSPASVPFYESPFIIDTIFDRHNYKIPRAVYLRPKYNDGSAIEFPNYIQERSYRFLVTGPAQLAFKVSGIRNSEAPTCWLYDQNNRLLGSASSLADGSLRIFNLPAAGYYRLATRFKLNAIDFIVLEMNSLLEQMPIKSLVNSYARMAMKTIEIDISPQQLANLNRTRARQERHWRSPIPEGAVYRNYPSYSEKVITRIRIPNGSWAIAQADLAGRNEGHMSSFGLPSLSLQVLSGELPYGLRKFKLYVLDSKEYGRDMILESVLKDFGLFIPRHDFARIILNGKFIGYMELSESVDTHMFEMSQRIEGPIVGFDPDDLIASSTDNKFTQKQYYKAKTFELPENTCFASSSFAEAICRDTMLWGTSFALAYAGMHGLNQTDLRYHFNSRRNCFDPMIKDINSTVGRIIYGESRILYNSLQVLSNFSPEWRPVVTSHASSLLLQNSSGLKEVDGFYWWSVMPSTLDFFNNSRNIDDFYKYLSFWDSKAGRTIVNSRMRSYKFVVDNLILDQSPLPLDQMDLHFKKMLWININPKDYSLTGMLRSPLDLSPSASAVYMAKLISQVSSGLVVPSINSLKMFSWRNNLINFYLNENKTKSLLKRRFPVDTGSSLANRAAISSLLVFLYRHEEDDFSHMFFVERLMPNQSYAVGDFYLHDQNANSYKATRVETYGSHWNDKLSKESIYLNDLLPDEFARLYYFKIPRSSEDLYLSPVLTGAKHSLMTRDMFIAAKRTRLDHSNQDLATMDATDSLRRLSSWFTVSGHEIRPKNNNLMIDQAVYIPDSYHLVISEPTELNFSSDACMLVAGSVDVADKASLKLKAATNYWQGIHFHDNFNLNLRNISVSDVGSGDERVSCFARKYTGAFSIFYSRASLNNISINNINAEDALHVVKSRVDIDGLTIAKVQSDALDADFSVLNIINSNIHHTKGDGLDVSGSNALIESCHVHHCADKAVSAGENSIVRLLQSRLNNAYYGVAAKDASRVSIDKTTKISKCSEATAIYIKKAYFTKPVIQYSN